MEVVKRRAESAGSDSPSSGSLAATSGASAAEPSGGGGDELLWQYRWAIEVDGLLKAEDGAQVYGPFDSYTMHGWIMQGCISEERQAEVRQCDQSNEPTERCWHPWTSVDFA